MGDGRMAQSFEKAWQDILNIARSREEIDTLVRRKVNDIVKVFEASITVRSKETGNNRILPKKDFQYAWNKLMQKRIIELQDIEPELRGRKSIIFAFLARLPYVNHEVKPLLRIMLKEKP